MTQYHAAFTSCNTIFRLDPALRATSWCGNCPKCRFVFLILAPFWSPRAMAAIFHKPMLDDATQYEGFALLTATGGHKPFECVGEEEESLAAISPARRATTRWRDRPVVRAARRRGAAAGATPDVAAVLALSDEHHVPDELIDDVHALLGA